MCFDDFILYVFIFRINYYYYDSRMVNKDGFIDSVIRGWLGVG